MSPEESLKRFLQPLLPAPDWSIQQGEWRDPGGKTRSVVIKAAGGPRAELVRRPALTLTFVGLAGGDIEVPRDAAQAFVAATLEPQDEFVLLEAAEPVYVPTMDGRAIFEVAVSAIPH